MKIKKIFISAITTCIIAMVSALPMITYATPQLSSNSNMDEQIELVIQEEVSKAKISTSTIAIIQGEDVEYLSYPDEYNKQLIDSNSLFQIGSVSKAYTGLGILLLEDKGLLSLDDPVSKYLPWFTFSYEGKTIPTDSFTISNLLYQTSGFTNDNTKYSGASDSMSIEESVRQINERELAFYPSQRFSYANANYRILGLIIESVSGQSYDAFMTERILLPLGLENTYTNPQKAQNTGKVVEGSRLSFFQTRQYLFPVTEGNIPAGYIYSNTSDMSRWLQIHMGKIEVSEQFKRIIEKSHQPNSGSIVDDNTHYAAGWFINDATGEIYHSGGTPNYSANVSIRPNSNIAVCVLTNMNASSNTNRIASNILNILEGKSPVAYQSDVWIVFDMIFSSITVVGIIGIVFFTFITLRIVKQIHSCKRIKAKLNRKRLLYFIPPTILTLLTVLAAVIIPIIFGSSWTHILIWWMDIGVWAPLSLVLGMSLLTVLSIFAFYISFSSAIYRKL